MTRNFRRAALVISLGLASIAQSAFAATATGSFTVSVSLTPKCEITGAIGNLSVNYTSWQAAAGTGSTNFNMRCTTGQPFTVALDNHALTDGTSGLAYTLKLSSSASPSGTDNETLSGTGSGGTGQSVWVHASVAANQEGTVAAGGTPNNVRTLTITY